MLHDRLWVYNEFEDNGIGRIIEKTGISPLLAKLFLSRGIKDPEYIRSFINPSMDGLLDPFLLKDMDKAVERMASSIERHEKVIIYGDYDVDGTTSVSILYDFLSKLGVDVDYYIPDRLDEGYGLSISAVDKIRQLDPSLIITADCGITAVDEIEYINSFGIDVIVTDHHECKEDLPRAYALVNPCRPDCEYPFKELAGVGVVYKLISAICKRLGLGDRQNEYLDLIALGTVADVVPLVGENRILVKNGMVCIENTGNLGLKTLIDNCGMKERKINSWTIGFVLAPRINAAGRTGDAGRVVRLFTTRDEAEALNIVTELNDANRYRQDTEAEILQQVIEIVETDMDLEKEKVIVVSGEGWHHGIIGIVASKVTEKYYRPCILISTDEGEGRGSGRSIEGFNMFNALNYCQSMLEKFGGHELAAGLSIRIENIPEFRKMINEYAGLVLTEEDLIPKVKIDLKVSRDDISINNIKDIELLAPFGPGNPGPVFAYEGLTVCDVRTVGEDKHLKLKLEDTGIYLDAIGFGMGNLSDVLKTGDKVDIACSLEINTWNSVERVQLNIRDIVKDRENLVRNRFFYTLERCIGSQELEESEKGYLKLSPEVYRECDEDYLATILSNFKSTAILVNSLEALNRLDCILRNAGGAIKKPYKICYTCFSKGISGAINVIVNPNPDFIDFSGVDGIIFFGGWISMGYLEKVLDKADSSKTFFCGGKIKNSINFEEIIPERRDLAAVYQYLKMNYGSRSLVDNLFILADRIAESYKIRMNYFKLKKGLDILEEVDVLRKEPIGRYGMLVTLGNNKREKANLDNSVLYRRLQALKSSSWKLEE